jgi:hypothetical protein
MTSKIIIKPGLLKRLREVHDLPSEQAQADMLRVDRTTLRRIDAGASPSQAFMASVSVRFGLGLGEAFEVVTDEPFALSRPSKATVAA